MRIFSKPMKWVFLYGNDSSAAPVINAVDIIREKKNTALVGSGSIFQSMNSTVTMNLSVIFKLRGVNFTIAGACASGSHAIGMGYLLIKSGLQDCILLRWRTRSQSLCSRKFRRTKRIFHPGSSPRESLETF